MSKEKRRVPKLRFPGFAEDWEQRKFGDLFEYERPDAYIVKSDNYNDDFNMPVLTANKAFILGYTNEENSYNKPSIIFDDFTLDRKYVDFPYMLKSSAIKILTSKNQHNLRFLFERLNSTRFELLGHARHYISVVQNTITFCPSVEEEVCISNLLTKFDELITLHQRKLNNLKLKKKALLQKLFPKNGERYPELRFPGFTDAWEQRKLSELATMNARIGWQNLRTSEFLDNGDYLLITGTDFDNGRIKYSTCHYVEKKRFDQDTKIQLSTGSILITKDGTLGKVALVEELPKPATLNAGVFNVRVKDDAFLSYKYLYHYLKAPFLMKYVTANATGGTIKHLNQSILVDFPIPITEKQEQDRIAKLLDSLESIITLHQRKLDHLQLQKKALLQQMFV